VKRVIVAIAAAAALPAALALPAQADPVPRTVKWECELEGGEVVTFVSAPEAARDGIKQANSTAGQVFATQFGEECHVV